MQLSLWSTTSCDSLNRRRFSVELGRRFIRRRRSCSLESTGLPARYSSISGNPGFFRRRLRNRRFRRILWNQWQAASTASGLEELHSSSILLAASGSSSDDWRLTGIASADSIVSLSAQYFTAGCGASGADRATASTAAGAVASRPVPLCRSRALVMVLSGVLQLRPRRADSQPVTAANHANAPITAAAITRLPRRMVCTGHPAACC